MRKNILFTLLLILFITGCANEKKIHCSFYEQEDNQKISYDYILKFDETGETLKTIKLKSIYELGDDIQLDEYIETIDSLCNNFKNEELSNFIKCETIQKDESIEMTIEYDFEKLSDEQKEQMLSSSESITFDSFKEMYENSGVDQKMCSFNSNEKLDPVLFKGGTLSNLSNSQVSAAENSASGILKTAETYIATYMLENKGNFPSELVFECDGNTCSTKIDGKTDFLDFKGTIPTSGSIYISSTGTASIKDELIINGYKCTMVDSKVQCQK